MVLLRYGNHRLQTAVKVRREQDGEISCVEPSAPFAGATWRGDASSITQPLVAYSIAGRRLLDETMFPRYDSIVDRGATIQVDGEDVLEASERVALQVVLVPHGEQPPHRETVGDRRIDDGEPDIWVVLDRWGDDLPGRLAVAQGIPRRPPPPLAKRLD